MDGLPLTFQKFQSLTMNFENEMSWDRVKLLLKLGMFVDVTERDLVVDEIVDKYCGWISSHGGLVRIIPKSFWTRSPFGRVV